MMVSKIEAARDAIYEAALLPGQWPQALSTFAKVSDGMGAVRFAAEAADTRWLASPELKGVMEEFIPSWANRNTRAARMLAHEQPGFVGELEVFKEEELKSEPVYAEFLHPRGMGWGAATSVVAPTKVTLIFAVERRLSRGPFTRDDLDLLDRLRPDLSRAAMLATRIGLEKAAATAETLELLGLPAAVLSPQRRIVFANDLLGALAPAITCGAFEKLAIADRQSQALFDDALQNCRSDARRVPLSIPIRASHDEPHVVAHFIPMRGLAHDLFTGAAATVVFTRVGAAAQPSIPLLVGLFDLTASEARVAALLAAARSPSDIADELGISLHTIKSHMKSIFSKTNTSRQVELVRLLDSLRSIPF